LIAEKSPKRNLRPILVTIGLYFYARRPVTLFPID